MSVRMAKYALSTCISVLILASVPPAEADTCWSEAGSCTGDHMEFDVACACSGGTCDIYEQCFDCEGGRLDGGDSTVNTTDEYLYDLVTSSCSLITAKNLGRTPSTYHPRLRVPVNVTTGNVAYSETDFRVTTPGLPIVFTRTWNSQGTIDEDLGDSWIHSYGWYVDDYETYGKIVVQGDGRTHYYNCEDSNDSYSACDGDGSEVAVYVAHPGPAEYLTLTEDNDDYILTFDHGQVVYYFDKDKDNRLRLMDHPDGNNILITFDVGDSDIDKISSRHDTTVYAEVDVTTDANHRITSIDDAESNTYTYSYTSGRLTSRAYPSSLGTRYFYYGDQTNINGTTVDLDDGNDTDNLTWVKDERSKIAAVFSYDTSDRCDHAGVGVVSNEILLYHEFDYATPASGQTTVKGPSMGGSQRSTVMTFESFFGIGAVTANSNTGCGSCGGVGYWSARDYDMYLNPVESTSQTSVVTQWVYDSDGLVTKIIEAEGDTEERVTEFTYNSTWEKVATIKRPSVYSTNQVTTTYTWNGTYGDLTSVQVSGYDWDGTAISRTTTYTRDSLRRITRVDGPMTSVNDYTDTEYWASGNGDKSYRTKKVTRRIKDSPSTDLVLAYYDNYDDNGNLLEQRDGNLVKTKYTFDAVGRMTEKHTIIGSEESCSTTTSDLCWEYTYLNNGLLDELELPEDNVLDYTYDDGNRRTKIERKETSAGSDIDYVSYTFNRENSVTKKQFYTGADTETWVQQYDYDVYWRRTKLTLPDEEGAGGDDDEISFSYNDDGQMISRTDARSKVTSYSYDGLGQLTGINLPGIGVSGDDYTYTYENVGLLEEITDPNDHDNDYLYDDFGNVRKVTTVDSGTYVFTYNLAGQVTQRTHTGLDTVSYTYDNAGRVTKTDYPSPFTDITYTYDSSHWVSGGHGQGRLTTMTDDSGTTHFKYDQVGRVIIEKWIRGSSTFLTSYWYDRNGNLDKIQYPSSRDIDYKYQSADTDRLDEIEGDWDTSSTYDFATSITYVPSGPIESFTYGNSLQFDADYTKRYQAKDWDIGTSADPDSLFDWTYSYDDDGNVTSISLPSSKAFNYTYDDTSRLTAGEDTRTSGGWGYRAWDYDGAGNVTYKYHDSSKTEANRTTYAYNTGTNQISGLSGYEDNDFEYNGAGSMDLQGPSGSDHDYYYDPDERLVRVKDESNSTVVDYEYDGMNRRRVKTFPGGNYSVFFFAPDGRLLSEIRKESSTWYVEDHIWMEGRLLARADGTATSFGGSVTDDEVYWYHLDQLGTPWKMTDDSQTTVWAGEYTPYGEVTIGTETITNNVRLPGQYWDNETHSSDARRLSQNWHRYYSSNLGEYRSVDPAILGTAVSLERPWPEKVPVRESYRYVGGSPVMAMDVTGLWGSPFGFGCHSSFTTGAAMTLGGSPGPYRILDKEEGSSGRIEGCLCPFSCISTENTMIIVGDEEDDCMTTANTSTKAPEICAECHSSWFSACVVHFTVCGGGSEENCTQCFADA